MNHNLWFQRKKKQLVWEEEFSDQMVFLWKFLTKSQESCYFLSFSIFLFSRPDNKCQKSDRMILFMLSRKLDKNQKPKNQKIKNTSYNNKFWRNLDFVFLNICKTKPWASCQVVHGEPVVMKLEISFRRGFWEPCSFHMLILYPPRPGNIFQKKGGFVNAALCALVPWLNHHCLGCFQTLLLPVPLSPFPSSATNTNTNTQLIEANIL